MQRDSRAEEISVHWFFLLQGGAAGVGRAACCRCSYQMIQHSAHGLEQYWWIHYCSLMDVNGPQFLLCIWTGWKALGKKKIIIMRKWNGWVFKPLLCSASKSNEGMFLMTCMKTMVKTRITRQLWEGQGGAVPLQGFLAFYSIYPTISCFGNRGRYCLFHVASSGDIWSPKAMIQLLLAGNQSSGVEDVPCKSWLEENDL